MPYSPSTIETEAVFQSIEHIKLKIEFQLKNPTGTPDVLSLAFFVNHELFFKIRKLYRIFDSDNFKTRIYVFGHDLVPDELRGSWEMDSRMKDMANDYFCAPDYYEGYDADLTEDWGRSFDDLESDDFLDDGKDEAYAPNVSYPIDSDILTDTDDEDAQSCWKYYDKIFKDTLLPPAPEHLIIITEKDLEPDDTPVDILSDSYQRIDQDDMFFQSVIMPIYSGTFENLKKEIQNRF